MDALKLITQESVKKEIPAFEVGDTVRVQVRIKEGDKERLQAFEGTVIAKKHGGAVLVDTNASNYEMIKQACDEDLIDVLGISLKGLTPEEAMSVSGVSKRQLCWDNVLKTIRYAADSSNTDVLIAYVVDRTTSRSDLDRFAFSETRYLNSLIDYSFWSKHRSFYT